VTPVTLCAIDLVNHLWVNGSGYDSIGGVNAEKGIYSSSKDRGATHNHPRKQAVMRGTLLAV